MRIIGYNDCGSLITMEVKVIGYESEDSTLWFWDGRDVFDMQMTRSEAEVKICEAYAKGQVDLRTAGPIREVE